MVDFAYVHGKRELGYSDSTIARMGGWCVLDVRSVPRAPDLEAQEAPVEKPERFDALAMPDIMEILNHVAEMYGVPVAAILGASHRTEIVEARHEAMALARELNRYSLRDLGEIFCKNNAAVLYGLRRHYARLKRSPW